MKMISNIVPFDYSLLKLDDDYFIITTVHEPKDVTKMWEEELFKLGKDYEIHHELISSFGASCYRITGSLAPTVVRLIDLVLRDYKISQITKRRR